MIFVLIAGKNLQIGAKKLMTKTTEYIDTYTCDRCGWHEPNCLGWTLSEFYFIATDGDESVKLSFDYCPQCTKRLLILNKGRTK